MVFGLEFLGFGSKRLSALNLLDRTLINLEVSPSQLDDGMKYIIYNWALEAETNSNGAVESLDATITDAAIMLSFCILGAADTEELWGAAVREAREQRFRKVLELGEDDTLDARLIKLVLAKDLAAPDIRAQAVLEE